MHELGLTRRVLEVALARASSAGSPRVTALHFEVGAESDVAPESVAFYWPEVSAATPAEGARLFFADTDDADAFRLVAIDVDGDSD